MALDHTRPPESLLRELEEVAHAAQALVAVLDRGLNFPLPPDFPTDQLTDICRSLMRLPEAPPRARDRRWTTPGIASQRLGASTFSPRASPSATSSRL